MEDFKLIGYTDSNLSGDKDTIVSTCGYTMILGLKAISWRSLKWQVPSYLTIEEEYVAAVEATKEIVWFRKILEDLQENQENSTPLLIEKTSTIKLANNPIFHD